MKSHQIKALCDKGLALHRAGRGQEALRLFEQALKAEPNFHLAHFYRAFVLRDLRRPDEALASIDKAISLQSDHVDAWNMRSAVLWELKRLDEALASIDKVVALNPGAPQGWSNRCAVLHRMKQLDEALVSADRAVQLDASHADAWKNRAIVLKDSKRLVEALASIDKALSLQPGNADSWNNRGLVLLHRKRQEEALASFDRAVALKPNLADAWYNRGNTLTELKRPEQAFESYAKAFEIKPETEFLFGNYLLAKAAICLWDGFEKEVNALSSAVRAQKRATYPFSLLGLLDDPALQKTAATLFSESSHPGNAVPGPVPNRDPHGKIRIGYYSSDFHRHATTYLMIELLEAHDAEKFELFGFSYGPDIKDDMRGRVAACFADFLDVRGKSDREIAVLSRECGLDIAVDLKGYTHDARPGIFAEGCAPIQVHYLGYPGTMGTNHVHYLIADRTVIPAESRCDFAEKIVWLPNSYQANDSQRKISDKSVTRQEAGLPENAFVYCCFNNNFKILPETFTTWMRILKAVDRSVLWLLEDNPVAAGNLRKEAARGGVDPARLVFAPRAPVEEHLARQKLADLFLDTWPCNAHTTASDALWAGLPVLTCMGRSFASRVAASLLRAVNLPGLVTASVRDYEGLAIDLALHPEKLAEIRQTLRANRTAAPLFDGRLTARHLEAAYEAIFVRHQSGLPPDHIEIHPQV